jgi:hypothetical protein
MILNCFALIKSLALKCFQKALDTRAVPPVVILLVMPGDRYKKRERNRKRQAERDEDEWGDSSGPEDALPVPEVVARGKKRKTKGVGGRAPTVQNMIPFKRKGFPLKVDAEKSLVSEQAVEEEESEVQHEAAKLRFLLAVPGCAEPAVLCYTDPQDGPLDFWHTEVNHHWKSVLQMCENQC